jgi:putative oxidoreductase
MKYVTLVSRILLGFMFFIFGLNNILHFIPMPPPSGDALSFMMVLGSHGWMTFVGVIMTVGGLLLAPVIVNIDLYHALLWPHGAAPAVVASLLEVILLVTYYRSFLPLFVPDPMPATKL